MTTPDPTAADAAADTRAALLDAAADELAEGGRADISLRAVARRAGVSHAAPAYFFRDRAGLLTAVAAGGFRDLAARLRAAGAPDGRGAVADHGAVYIGFALERPAVFDLMFASPDLRLDDDDLTAARAEALGALDAATRAATADSGPPDTAPPDTAPPDTAPPDTTTSATLVRWAFAHGVALLLRAGALQAAVGEPAAVPADLVGRLLAAFSAEVNAPVPPS